MRVEATTEHGGRRSGAGTDAGRPAGDPLADGGSPAVAGKASGPRPNEPGRVAEAPLASARPGFVRRYRLPIALAIVALCLYAGSILYILYWRGQIA